MGGVTHARLGVRLRRGVHGQTALVALLLGVAAVAWWSSADQSMAMDPSPLIGVAALAWFFGMWLVMMAAMMLPAAAPTVALYARVTRQRDRTLPLLFTSAYLLVWSAAGLAPYALLRTAVAQPFLDHPWLTALVFALGAIYQLTPLKNACLTTCRSPLGFLLTNWRDGRRGALVMGARHAGWCLGCCWMLMGVSYAVGCLSIEWMAVAAALITAEKVLPWRRTATIGTAAILLALAITTLVVPSAIPCLDTRSIATHMTAMP
jgi:predicted metal-binding membrane protein